MILTGACVDITERKRAEEHLAHLASHDALTDLPNRTLLQKHLEQCISRAGEGESTFALLLLDLDRFKEINDTFGHHYGDIILRSPEAPCLLGFRPALRHGGKTEGDEFGILLPGADEMHANAVADRLLTEMGVPIVVDGQLLRCRGQHRHRAPSRTRIETPRHFSSTPMLPCIRPNARGPDGPPTTRGAIEHTPRRLRLVGELRRAISSGQLRLHYQPTVDLKTMRPVGVEALVRWQHPRHGLLGPDEFIPIAEHTGLIRPLGLWALRAALAQRRTWSREALDLRVSVNLSPENLQDDQLIGTIDRILNEYEVPTRRLTVEVTEGR